MTPTALRTTDPKTNRVSNQTDKQSPKSQYQRPLGSSLRTRKRASRRLMAERGPRLSGDSVICIISACARSSSFQSLRTANAARRAFAVIAAAFYFGSARCIYRVDAESAPRRKKLLLLRASSSRGDKLSRAAKWFRGANVLGAKKRGLWTEGGRIEWDGGDWIHDGVTSPAPRFIFEVRAYQKLTFCGLRGIDGGVGCSLIAGFFLSYRTMVMVCGKSMVTLDCILILIGPSNPHYSSSCDT